MFDEVLEFFGVKYAKQNIRGLLITRHNSMYYKIKNDKVIIINMYDTRMNPKKNPY